MTTQPDSDLHAELAALRQRLSHLEAEQEARQRQAAPVHRPAFVRRLLLGPLSLAILVVGSGLLYAQGDALFIDRAGDVSIARNLKVTGNVATTGSVTTSRLEAASAQVTGTLSTGLLSTGSLVTTGNVDIGDSSSAATLRIGSPLPDLLLGGMPSPQNNGLRLHYAKELKVGVLDVTGDSFRLRGFTKEGHQTDRMTFDLNTGHVGIGANAPQETLHVGGNARIDGGVTSKARYQRNDDAEKTYDISPRYHLSLTAATYDGRTKVIPAQTLKDLCGDQDGCEVRLGMTQWKYDTETETASRSFLFYYLPSDGHWRSSYEDKAGTIKNNTTEHAAHIWNVCYFTDGTYLNNQDKGDRGEGMALLVSRNDRDGYTNPKRTCELTLID